MLFFSLNSQDVFLIYSWHLNAALRNPAALHHESTFFEFPGQKPRLCPGYINIKYNNDEKDQITSRPFLFVRSLVIDQCFVVRPCVKPLVSLDQCWCCSHKHTHLCKKTRVFFNIYSFLDLVFNLNHIFFSLSELILVLLFDIFSVGLGLMIIREELSLSRGSNAQL